MAIVYLGTAKAIILQSSRCQKRYRWTIKEVEKMNEELMLLAGLGIFAVGFGLKHYRKLRTKVEEALEDGELSLDEALDIVQSVEETIEEAKSLPSPSAMKRMRKDELKALCAKHEIDAKGTKDEIIARLREALE